MTDGVGDGRRERKDRSEYGMRGNGTMEVMREEEGEEEEEGKGR